MVSHILFSQSVDSKNHSLEKLRDLFHRQDDRQQLISSLLKLLDENFRYYQITTAPHHTAAIVTALSLAIEYRNIDAFDIIFEKYQSIHYRDVLASLECDQPDYLNKLIAAKPFKTFEYLLQIALMNNKNALLTKAMAAMQHVIALKGSDFLSKRAFKYHDNAVPSQSALSAAVSHYHIPLIEFFIEQGASPNSEVDGEDGARLLDMCAYQWYDKRDHAPAGLIATCLALIRLGAELNTLTVEMKTLLLQAAIEQKEPLAARRLLGLKGQDACEQEKQYFSLFSLGQTLSQRLFNTNANIHALSSAQRSELSLLLDNKKSSPRITKNY